MKQKRSVILLIAALIATASFAYLVSYMITTGGTSAGAAIAMTLAIPSVVCSGFGTFFAWLGWLSRVRGFVLAAGILFAVAMALMIPWFMFNVVQMALCFIAYVRMKK